MKLFLFFGVNIIDNKFYVVRVEWLGNMVILQVDYVGRVEGSIGGSNNLIDNGGGVLFFGGFRRLIVLKVLQVIVKSYGKVIV